MSVDVAVDNQREIIQAEVICAFISYALGSEQTEKN